MCRSQLGEIYRFVNSKRWMSFTFRGRSGKRTRQHRAFQKTGGGAVGIAVGSAVGALVLGGTHPGSSEGGEKKRIQEF